MKILKKIVRFITKVLKWTFITFGVLALISALYNLTLPVKSKTIERLSSNQKAYIAEAINLQQKLGNELWPEWGDAQIPVIVYNEKYAFLIGYQNPPAGWFQMPGKKFKGKKWEVLTNDDFYGVPYFRQSLPDSKVTPENFTVKVGEQWVASIQTKEYATVNFYHEFRDELPPVINAIFPYTIFWNILMGNAENYIVAIEHEMFHAFQGKQVPKRFNESEKVAHLSSGYPWHEFENAAGWNEEMNYLLEAYNSGNEEERVQFVKKFIEKRNTRRRKANLPDATIQYEQKREWLEGLAKYAELNIGLMASANKHYRPVIEIEDISNFKYYTAFPTFLKRQIEEVKRAATRSDENRFYYTGMLQALMLDSMMPAWKPEVFNEEVYLENLLEKAVKNYE